MSVLDEEWSWSPQHEKYGACILVGEDPILEASTAPTDLEHDRTYLAALAPRMARFILTCDWDETDEGERLCSFDLGEYSHLRKELEALR